MNCRNWFLISLLLFAFSFSFCQVRDFENEVNIQLAQLFDKEFNKYEPGGAVLIQKGKDVVFSQSYGLADLELKLEVNQNTVFNTGSISKTFVANGILILQESGLLTIEDPISKYFDDFENEEIASSVKIKHLLSHTSGLPDLREVRSNSEFYITAKDRENFDPIKKVQKLNFPSGERFQYSNPAYNGLALIIEKVSGKPWQDFIEENIFKPCNMHLSEITNGPHPSKNVAHAYIKTSGEYKEFDYGEYPTFAAAGNGGVWSTVHELANYEECVQHSVFLNSATIEESRTVFKSTNWDDSAQPHLGWGWFLGEESLLGEESNLGVKIIYHTGSQGGFRAYFISIPEKDIISVGLFNRPVDSYRRFISEPLKILADNNWLD